MFSPLFNHTKVCVSGNTIVAPIAGAQARLLKTKISLNSPKIAGKHSARKNNRDWCSRGISYTLWSDRLRL